MIKRNPFKILIGIVCILVLVFAAVVALVLDSRSPDPVFGIFRPETTAETEEITKQPEDTQKVDNSETDSSNKDEPDVPAKETADASNGQLTPPEDLPSSVVIPTDKDPNTGESAGIKFPCQVPEYGLVIEKIAPYSGMYVEDGSNANMQNVAMLMVHNKGDFPLEYTQICVEYGDEKLLFDISALPVGEKLVVQEKDGKAVPDTKASSASAMVVQRADMDMSESKVEVTDNGNNTLTIKNLTNETIPTVRVFYKYYMEDEGVFVGGIAFTVKVTRLGAGSAVKVQPSHYTSQTSRVVMVLTYDSEV